MYQKIIFSNKLRLVLAPRHETKAVTVLVLFKVGSRYEKRKINGVSHFIEHMMFKGTKRRPTTLALSKELDRVGAEYNAFTAKDHTGYYIKINHEKIDLALDILADMLWHSKFDSKEIHRERKVIIEEINMFEDNPLIYIENLFEQTLYGKENPLGQLVIGSKEIVNQIAQKEILNYKDNFYQPSNIVVVVAGRFEKNRILKLVKKYFKNLKIKSKFPKFQKFINNQRNPRVELKFKETKQVQLCLGFPAYSYFHKNIYPLYLLGIILGGNMSSRLFISIREKKGLAYFIKSSINVYEDTGNLVIQAGLSKIQIKKAVKTILGELKKISQKEMGLKELQKAKDFLKGKLTLELEDSENLANWIGKQELLKNEILTPEEQFKRIDKVTSRDIKIVAQEIFRLNKLNIVVISPLKDKKEFFKLLEI